MYFRFYHIQDCHDIIVEPSKFHVIYKSGGAETFFSQKKGTWGTKFLWMRDWLVSLVFILQIKQMKRSPFTCHVYVQTVR